MPNGQLYDSNKVTRIGQLDPNRAMGSSPLCARLFFHHRYLPPHKKTRDPKRQLRVWVHAGLVSPAWSLLRRCLGVASIATIRWLGAHSSHWLLVLPVLTAPLWLKRVSGQPIRKGPGRHDTLERPGPATMLASPVQP